MLWSWLCVILQLHYELFYCISFTRFILFYSVQLKWKFDLHNKQTKKNRQKHARNDFGVKFAETLSKQNYFFFHSF